MEATTTLSGSGFPTKEASRRDMNALDRCDLCGAKAWVRAVLHSSELLFCAHHGSQHIDALYEKALFVQDDRSELAEEELL